MLELKPPDLERSYQIQFETYKKLNGMNTTQNWREAKDNPAEDMKNIALLLKRSKRQVK